MNERSITLKAGLILNKDCYSIADCIASNSKGTKKDYYSEGTYWWPNPETKDHLPYIKRDGFINPENFKAHKNLILDIVNDTETLYKAYKITKDDSYIKKIGELLDVFFLDKKRGMNPSLKYSQAIPGESKGRSIGLIDMLQDIDLPFLIRAIEREKKEDLIPFDGMKEWLQSFSTYLLESPFGIKEQGEKNNHSIAVFLQILSYSEFRKDRKTIAKKCYKKIIDDYIPTMIEIDGSMPQEVKRTRSYHYSMFTIEMLTTLAFLLKDGHRDIFYRLDERGVGLKTAIDFMAKYISDPESWPYEDNSGDLPLLRRPAFLFFAYMAYSDERYKKIWENIEEKSNLTHEEDRRYPIKCIELYLRKENG